MRSENPEVEVFMAVQIAEGAMDNEKRGSLSSSQPLPEGVVVAFPIKNGDNQEAVVSKLGPDMVNVSPDPGGRRITIDGTVDKI